MRKRYSITIPVITFMLLLQNLMGQNLNSQNIFKLIEVKNKKMIFQEIPNNDIEVIRIWQSNYQVLEIRKMQNDEYQGKLINYVSKCNIIGKKKSTILEVIKIDKDSAKELLEEMKQLGINSIKDSNEIENYPMGLDGKTTIIETFLDSQHHKKSYWEIENDYYIDKSNPDIIKVRSIINVLNQKISWWPLFKHFRDQLEPGTYCYGGLHLYIAR